MEMAKRMKSVARCFLGSVLGTLTAFFFNRLISLAWFIFLFRQMTDDELLMQFGKGTTFYVVGTIGIVIAALLGGWVTARVSKLVSYWDVVLMFLLTLGLGSAYEYFLEVMYGSDLGAPSWYKNITFFLFLPSAFLGGFLAKRKLGAVRSS